MSEQQLAFARLRAVEHGRYVVVAGTTGISAAIAPDGQELARTQFFTPAYLDVDVRLRTAQTPALAGRSRCNGLDSSGSCRRRGQRYCTMGISCGRCASASTEHRKSRMTAQSRPRKGPRTGPGRRRKIPERPSDRTLVIIPTYNGWRTCADRRPGAQGFARRPHPHRRRRQPGRYRGTCRRVGR